jgi:hypothetical protein
LKVETLEVSNSYDYNSLKKYFKRKPSEILLDNHRTYDEITKELWSPAQIIEPNE